MDVETIAGLLQVDHQLEDAAERLSLAALALDSLQARCDQHQDIYAAQRLQDVRDRLRLTAATVGSVQAVLGGLANDGDDQDATAELGPLRGRPHAWSRG